MNEAQAIKVLVKMLKRGTTREALEAKAWELSIEVAGWCEPSHLVLKAEMAVA
jgi:hypothetical protein